MRVRKNVSNLTPGEKTAFVNAVLALKNQPSVLRPGQQGRYDDYVLLHMNAMMAGPPPTSIQLNQTSCPVGHMMARPFFRGTGCCCCNSKMTYRPLRRTQASPFPTGIGPTPRHGLSPTTSWAAMAPADTSKCKLAPLPSLLRPAGR